MQNNFQKSLLNNKNCIWEIVKLFHPDISEDEKNKIKVSIKYDWVTIAGSDIDIGIKFECHLMSGPKPMYLFNQELNSNKFRAWRFATDSKFKLESRKEYKYLQLLYTILVNEILSKHDIEKPSAQQMSDYYHSD